jgi:hypothetical protein
MGSQREQGDAARMIGSLGTPQRLRVVAAVIMGAGTHAEVRAATGLDARTVHREVVRLLAAGVVEDAEDGRFMARTDALAGAARSMAKDAAGVAVITAPETAEEKVRRAFLKDGHLVSIPSQRSKRMVILDVLAQEFEPGRRYPEKEVNRRLRAWHPDYAALRRYLVDEGFMEREHGEYRRAGGSFPVS